MNDLQECALCGMEDALEQHHLIPRAMHKRKWFRNRFSKDEMKLRTVDICPLCHTFIHRQWSEKELGSELNTVGKLLETDLVQNFITYARKQTR